MSKRYSHYCPMAHALDLVGERWALLIARELVRGPRRYTDLVASLPGIGTNILAARLRDLEANGLVERRKLPPPAASWVYELTDYGQELRPVMRELAVWGARSLGPPTEAACLFEGWLANAMDTLLAPVAPAGRFEFRVGDEVASLIDGEIVEASIEDPDVVVEADADAVYHMFVDQNLDRVQVTGDHDLLVKLIEAAPRPLEAPASA